MIRIFLVLFFSVIIMVYSYTQTQLDLQGSEISSEAVAHIKLNYSGPNPQAIGLDIDALTGRDDDLGLNVESTGIAIVARSSEAIALSGQSSASFGILGSSSTVTFAGVHGIGNNDADGVLGRSTTGRGIVGESTSSNGIYGSSVSNYGAYAKSTSSYGLLAESVNSYGAYIKGATGNLLLAAATGFGNGDDSVIRTEENLPDGDLYLISNDATVIQLDADENSAGRLLIKNDGDIDVFEMRENGNLLVRSETGTVRLEVEEDGDVLVGGAMVLTSDRNQKEEIVDIEQNKLLESLKKLPIYEWQYKGKERRHIGPMAQDFHAVFGLGDDDKTIATIDADGIALAAIQAQQELIDHQSKRIEEQSKQIANQSAKIEDLISRLDQLEKQLPDGDPSN